MGKKILAAMLSLTLALLCTVSPWTSYVPGSVEAKSGMKGLHDVTTPAPVNDSEMEVTDSKQLALNNTFANGNFENGTAGFSSTNFSVVTGTDGNSNATVQFDTNYRTFVSGQTSLQANVTYTFSFDFFVTSDNPNMFAYGLSTVAGHPGAGQTVTPSGTAPFTITDLNNNSVLMSNTANTSLVRYGYGARTLAVDGVDRSQTVDAGGWRRFTTTFTLSSSAPSVYFYFMSYEQGKKADGITPLDYIVGKSITFDNVILSQQINNGNHMTNGNFEMGLQGFKTSNTLSTYNFLTAADGNMYAKVTYDSAYRNFVSEQTSLQANTPYTFSFDYFIPADNPNQFAYGLSTVAGHPGTGQYLTPSGTAPYTITNLDTGATVQSSTSNTRLYHFGSGTRTLAVDGVNRSDGGETGGWRRFTVSFTLSSAAPSVYFYFMSYEQGKKADGITPLAYIANKSVSYDNVTVKGLYNVSVSAGTGGKANMLIIDTTSTAGKVNEGGRVLYTAKPDYLKEFTGWQDGSGTIISTNMEYLAEIMKDTSLMATFAPCSGSSTVTVAPSTGGSISSVQYGGTIGTSTPTVFSNGTYITLKATPDAGKSFVAWIDQNNEPISYTKNYTFCVKNTLTLKPLFDTDNKVYNNDFGIGTNGWQVYGETGSNAAISVLDSEALENENIPASPLGNPALKLSFDRTDGALNKRVQAYGTVTFATEKNTTYEVSVWTFSKYHNARLSLFVPTVPIPYHYPATNDFTYVYGGYNIGATQLAGSYKYLLNDTLQSSTGAFSMYTTPYRSLDSAGNKNGWTKISMIFTTDGNDNCVKNAAIALGAQTYSKDGVNYTAGAAYFTDVSVKKYSSYTVANNNKTGGMVTSNGNVVLSTLGGSSLFGKPLELKADAYEGFQFDGWFKNSDSTPFSLKEDITILYTGSATYTGKYSYDMTVPNPFLDDFETLPNGTDLEDTGTNPLGVWKLLSASTGAYTSWGSYSASDGTNYGVTPHGGNGMLAAFGRYNVSHRTLDVEQNKNYMFSFYYYQKTGTNNALEYVSITTNNSSIKTGSQTERTAYSSDFLAYNYTAITANGAWRKYTLTFNSGSNTTLKLFMKYNSPATDSVGYFFMDDFSLLPLNTETASGSPVALSISNHLAPLNTTFKGISSTVYHGYTYMDDAYGRNYTDEMATFEFDRLKNSGVKLVRSIFKSQWAWSDSLGTWDWNAQRMQDFYQWAEEMQDRGISIALNAGWHLPYLVNGTSSIPEVPYLYANGDYTLACARYGQWITEALQACQSRGITNITHVIVFTEPSYPTAENPVGPHAAQWVQAIYALDTAMRSAGIRNSYKLVGPNHGSIQTGEGLLNYALLNADSAIDVYSTHFYPRSTSILDDNYGTLTNTVFSSYMSVMNRNNSTKDLWCDEFFAASHTDAVLGMDNGWSGTQTAVGVTSAMNVGLESLISWQMLDQLWVDHNHTSGEFINGIHTCGTAPSLFVSPVPKHQYYALTMMSKYLGNKNGRVYTSSAPAGTGLYISTAKMEDGSWSVMVANASTTTQKFQATFGTAINQTLYRHLFNPATIQPDASAKVIKADKVYNNVGTTFVDSIPSGGIAIYTGLDF